MDWLESDLEKIKGLSFAGYILMDRILLSLEAGIRKKL